ncbi:hypothetical protein GCM10023200_56010 [Actinomycetospora chlora]|uniref:ChrB N-terminal domain-containing protein n=1 Tax=Actinomycetospora chlora TaxID=663608 RepID=A0ABP9CM34_9PSEU
MTSGLEWLLAVVQVPAQPSRHRVAVWRELRRAGAVPVSQGTWAMPDADPYRQALDRASELASDGGGSVAVFAIQPQDETSRALVEEAFMAARLDEWREFLADCGKFTDEIAREVAKEKFTFAELEEEEQSLHRLRRWYRDLKKRDVLALPDARTAATALHECGEILDRYAEQVYAANRATATPDVP